MLIKAVKELEAEIDKVKEEDIAEKYGMPLPLAHIIKNISEGVPEAEEGIQFLSDIPDAIGADGKDLSLVHWQFLRDTLLRLPKVTPEIKVVIKGMRLLAKGKKWSYSDNCVAVSATSSEVDNWASWGRHYESAAANAAYKAARVPYDKNKNYAASYAAGTAAQAALAADCDARDAGGPVDWRIERRKQAASLIQLLKEAPLKEAIR